MLGRHATVRHSRALFGLCAALVLAGCAATGRPGPGAPEPPGTAANEEAPGPIRQAIGRRLTENETGDAAIHRFYDQRDDRAVWYDEDSRQPRNSVTRFLDYLDGIHRQGLAAGDYLGLRTRIALSAGAAPAPPDTLARRDIALSRAFVRLAHDLDRGRVTDPAVHGDWPPQSNTIDYVARLAQAADEGEPAQVLAALAPQHAGYRQLITALAHYRGIAADGGWPPIATGPVLEPGMADDRVPALRRRLQISGDAPTKLTPDVLEARRYTSALADAVRHYQRRNGLHADGRVGPTTRAALDVPVAARIRRIELNLERWRWMPDDFGARYISVNIPDFSLKAVKRGVTVLSMNVIVGGSYDNRATPVFSDIMRYLIFRPFWNVPHHIAVDEIIPHARRDPAYMRRRGYQIVRAFGPNATPLAITPDNLDAVVAGHLQVRQAGGASNALGLVKFMFPNRYAVYLHSTPAGQLFGRSQRALSHGCVRVAKPEALAAFALAGRTDWNAQRIHQAMQHGRRQRVNLAEPLPVYLMYWTAFVNDDGINFRNDIYGHDLGLEAALGALAGGAT